MIEKIKSFFNRKKKAKANDISEFIVCFSIMGDYGKCLETNESLESKLPYTKELILKTGLLLLDLILANKDNQVFRNNLAKKFGDESVIFFFSSEYINALEVSILGLSKFQKDNTINEFLESDHLKKTSNMYKSLGDRIDLESKELESLYSKICEIKVKYSTE